MNKQSLTDIHFNKKMDIINDERVRSVHKLIKVNDNKKLLKLLNSKAKEYTKVITENYNWREFTPEVIRLKSNKDEDFRLILKRMIIEDTDFRCELFVNVILTIESPDDVVKVRNVFTDKTYIYIIFDYHYDGTVHHYIEDNPNISTGHLFKLFLACMDAIKKMNTSQYKINHFDCRGDNMFIDINPQWEDIEDSDDDACSVLSLKNDEFLDSEEQYHVKIGDFGLCEFTMHGKRYENRCLPRKPKHKKRWGLYPMQYTECYDILYFLICVQDNLEEIGKKHYMNPIWDFIESKNAAFDRKNFFTKQGRMVTFIKFTHVDVNELIDHLKKNMVTKI